MIPKSLSTKGASRPSKSVPLSGFFDFLGSQGFGDLQAAMAIRYYNACAPVASAVDKVAEPFSEIQPIVRNSVTKKEFPNHPVLDLLKNPNPTDSTESFMMKFAAWYIINGEVYLTASGPVNKPPLELFVDSAAGTSLQPDRNDGFLGSVQFGMITDTTIYSRAENTFGKRFRFYNHENDAEAWQVARFNPKQTNGQFRGQSKLQSVMAEIEQYIEASTHNLSILSRGARPSGVFTSAEPLTDPQFEKLKGQIDNWFSGASNAGRPILIEGGGETGVTYKDVMMSARDMDFLKLKENVTEATYVRLEIPLALVLAKTMTLDNLKVANLSLYDNAVIPLVNRLYGELTQMLMPRYPNSENLEISFNPTMIPALETRRMDQIKLRKLISVNTINEMRRLLNDEDLPEGGDEVLQPANLIPVGSDFSTGGEKAREASEYEKILKQQTDENGERKFTDQEVQAYMETYF
jgi:HK97 family phage portal protein